MVSLSCASSCVLRVEIGVAVVEEEAASATTVLVAVGLRASNRRR